MFPANRYTGLATGAATVKEAPAVLYGVTAYNANAAARYLQVHDTKTTLAGAEVPVLSVAIPATSQVTVGETLWGDTGMKLSAGLTLAVSTTRETYTAATASEHSIFGFYV